MNWTEEYDQLLAETFLKLIREGSSQITVFDEIGKKLNIPAVECLFRWNSVVRHNYKNAIALAKKHRDENFYKKIDSIESENRRLSKLDDNDMKQELKEAQELIKKLYNHLGGSADGDHKLWQETEKYCKEKRLL
jgi:RsfA family transcription factor